MANRPDPHLDEDGKPSFILQWQYRVYKKLDPPEKQQVALTGSIIKGLSKMAFTPLDKAMCQLFTGAFFFAMHSCEYLRVSGKCRTKLLTVKNIRFFRGRREIKHNNKFLHLAETVSITFEFQKKDTHNDTVTHFRSGHNSICPVLVWSKIVQRIRSYPSSTDKTSVNTFMDKNNKI
jgi:hypothetical protein